MALARDSTGSIANQTGSTGSQSFTNTAGNIFLFFGQTAYSSLLTFSSITYGGKSLTKLDGVNGVGGRNLEVWYLNNPPLGTNTLSITMSGIPDTFWNAGWVTYSGAWFSAPTIFGHNSSGSTTSLSKSLTTITDNSWIVSGFTNGANAVPTPGANTNIQLSVYNRTSSYELYVADSNGPLTPPGSFSNGYTWTGSFIGEIVCVIIAPITLQISLSRGSFTLTGFNLFKVVLAQVGSFILTGFTMLASISPKKWTNSTKNNTTWTNTPKT